ncbi:MULTISPECIES: carboxy terminal-processing peptidase [Crateriforma]|uniref:Tail-specific protease n=1 Tax=Crateriforma conspicua TaxID=2527996 RepID=A0A5C6FXD5_9PLAN|nr:MULTISPECIES: carboxy terminal-processing peptidase [Crateriforma]TWU67056.1 Tail-specific protease precursor [Crateriforma conspicua]
MDCCDSATQNLTHRPSSIVARCRPGMAIVMLLVSSSVMNPIAAQEAAPANPPARGPSMQDRQLAQIISQLMPRQHVSSRELDDQISQRALDLYLNMLDPLKIYFLQGDVDQFRQYEASIDDLVKRGDINPAYVIFNRFTKRVDERVAMAMQLLDQDFDFTKEESIVVDPDQAQYARNDAEARDRWRKQIKYAMLLLMDDDKTAEEAKDQLRRRYQRYARRWKDTDSDDLLEMYLTSVTSGFDPHSTYMSPGTLEDFRIQMRLNLEGIGAALREKDGNTVVSSVIPGGAADKDGRLKPDDVIVSVGQGDSGESVDIVEMPLKDVVDLIRGKAGTTVRLGVKPGGVSAVEEYKIIRAQVELEESAARGEILEHQVPGVNQPLKIGYINLPSFYLDMEKARDGGDADYRSSTRDVRKILDDFRAKGVAGVVLDLSKNGGGSLTEAITLTGLFIDHGPVVQVKDSRGNVTKYDDDEHGVAWDGPLVVLTSKLSASASEILAGAIRDYRRGIVIGDPNTHGKGTVQTLVDIGEALFSNQRANLGALKVTLQKFYLPDGESTQLKGVPADIVLPSIIAKMDVGESDLDYAIEFDRVPAKRHDLYSLVPRSMVDQLRRNSQMRVQQNDEFTDLLRRIELYVRQKERDTLSINEEEFKARRKELEAAEEDDKLAEEMSEPSDKIYPDSFYYDEVMNITYEYIQALRAQNLARLN